MLAIISPRAWRARPRRGAAPLAGAVRPSSARARLIEMFMLNSLTRLPDLSGLGTALISTSSGFSRYGEAPRLRMSVETRAFDCA
jgi:hypothetical protein